MRPTKFFSLSCWTVLLLLSCNSNTAAGNNKPGTGNVTTSGGRAVFSYNLDGIKIAGGPTDITPFNNSAQLVQTSDNGTRLQFFLNDAGKDAETFPHSLRFVIPGKTGTVTLHTDESNWNVGLFIANEEGKYIMYANESFTVTITVISGTHVAGSFSGKLQLVEGQTGKKKELIVSDGVFDIPVHK